eukprot:6473768-Amphidinium_carterae.3
MGALGLLSRFSALRVLVLKTLSIEELKEHIKNLGGDCHGCAEKDTWRTCAEMKQGESCHEFVLLLLLLAL